MLFSINLTLFVGIFLKTIDHLISVNLYLEIGLVFPKTTANQKYKM